MDVANIGGTKPEIESNSSLQELQQKLETLNKLLENQFTKPEDEDRDTIVKYEYINGEAVPYLADAKSGAKLDL
ncbi:conserved hypothetical protein [Roseibium sp. TrichSKD4]|uniref:hypothetical protein n=1 Tax=Roseibium sp. TrichSKD4 TaxID=744980 RepID=UPI0001E5733A|nr:hypothetical protein [Roseibium sp. TrichSKD4]EFO29146.1 conserved hypothetical protein [Roseibium sp. TrichSKD4]